MGQKSIDFLKKFEFQSLKGTVFSEVIFAKSQWFPTCWRRFEYHQNHHNLHNLYLRLSNPQLDELNFPLRRSCWIPMRRRTPLRRRLSSWCSCAKSDIFCVPINFFVAVISCAVWRLMAIFDQKTFFDQKQGLRIIKVWFINKISYLIEPNIIG